MKNFLNLREVGTTLLNKLTLTAQTVGFTISGGTTSKTLTVNKTISLTSADDTGVYTLPTGTKTLVATDGNITGTASNLSGTPALPNGTTATTQTVSDNSTKLATTAYVDTIALGAKAATNQTMYIGTTSVAINRSSGALTMTGVTLQLVDSVTATVYNLSVASGKLILTSVP